MRGTRGSRNTGKMEDSWRMSPTLRMSIFSGSEMAVSTIMRISSEGTALVSRGNS